MTFKISRTGDTIRADFQGFLTFHDHRESERLLEETSSELGQGAARHVVFDLGNVEALDSHWLGVFIRVLRHARDAGADLVIQRPQPDVRRLFSVIELDRIMTVAD